MFIGRGPTFSAIEGDWVNYGLVDLCLEIFWHFLITQDSGDLFPLEPRCVDSCLCVGDGVAFWRDQGPKVFELGCLLQLLAVNADGAIGLGAAFEVLCFGDVDFEPVFIEPAVPLLYVLLEVCVHWIHKGDINSVKMHPGRSVQRSS